MVSTSRDLCHVMALNGSPTPVLDWCNLWICAWLRMWWLAQGVSWLINTLLDLSMESMRSAGVRDLSFALLTTCFS